MTVIKIFNQIRFQIWDHFYRIFNQILFSLIFILILTPLSIIARFFGRDRLKLKKRHLESYWEDRSPMDSPSNSFEKQY